MNELKSDNKIIAAHAAEANAQGERAARQQCHRYSTLKIKINAKKTT